MAKFKLSAKTFNSTTIIPTIELYIDGLLKINQAVENNGVISTRVYSSAKQKIIDFLKEIFPSLNIKQVGFHLISRDLEMFKSQMITPEAESLVEVIFILVVQSISKELKIETETNLEKQISLISDRESEFKHVFIRPKKGVIENKILQRVLRLYEEKQYADALPVLEEIIESSLTIYEKEEYSFIQFQLFTKNATEDVEQKFRSAVKDFNDNPKQIKRFYFEYIRFLENLRDARKPRTLISEFEEKYPISILSEEELAYYYYLKGRAEYGRGDFLLALDNLSNALKYVDESDEQLIASIFNTAVNSFTDNLFFQEAEQIGQKALTLREKYKLPEKQETVSLLGGIEFKYANFSESLEKYLESEKLAEKFTLTSLDKNRLYNYIAKSAIMVGDYKKAKTYIDKANVAGDTRGFSKTTELLKLLKEQEYSEMAELFKNTIMLPENRKPNKYDYFAIAWGYVIMALASFEQKKFNDGIEYLYKGADYFYNDMYILEAFYVSLYLYQYAVPEKEIEKFREMIGYSDLQNEFEEYIQKHISISKTYSDIFGAKQGEKNLLQRFHDDTKNITDENYNPEEVKEILNSICLM